MSGSDRPAGVPLAACLVALTLAHAVPGHAQVLDRGSFTLYQEGVRIGEERFVIRQERGGAQRMIVARGELNLKTDGETLRVRIALEVGGPDLTPRRYEAEFDGAETTAILGIVSRNRLRINARSSGGEQIRQFLPGGAWTILEDGIAHHYWFAAKLASGGASRVAAIVPRGARQLTLRVEDRGVEATTVGQRQLELRHLVLVTSAGQSQHVWLDDERVMKVEVPATGWSAVRSDTGTANNPRAGDRG